MANKPKKRKRSPKARAKRGRPEIFSQALADQILDRMAVGETLTQICNDNGMPHRATVRRWLHRYPDFATAYAQARTLLADVYAEQAIDIADDASGDIVEKDGKRTVDWESVQRSRLRCDMRRWYAAKLAPRKYGEKVTTQLTGAEEGPIQIGPPMTPAEVAVAVADLITAAERQLGLPSGEGQSNDKRITAIRMTGRAIPPELYAALHQGRNPDDAVH